MIVMRLLVFALALCICHSGFAAESFGTCTKDGKEVKVEGNDEKSQSADCAKQGGKWEKKKAKASQDSGSGGGW